MKAIYKITNPNGKVYIGQTKNVSRRKHEYKRMHCKHQVMLYNSIQKYGWDSHTFEVIEYVEDDLANSREIYFIELYNSLNDGLNLTPGGIGYNISDVQKKKISNALLGAKNVRAKTVYQYDLQGNLINKWLAMKDIERALNYKTTALSAAIRKKRPAYGFIWSHGDFYLPSPKRASGGGKTKRIYQYSKDGVLINTFSSITEAVKATGLNRSTIRRNIQDISTSRSSIWTNEPLH